MIKKIILFNLLISFVFGAKLHFDTYKFHNGSGETLLVLGGIHGDEPGGYFAPSVLITNYRIKKGNLWVAPNLNFDSIIQDQRGIYGDMNRKFSITNTKDEDFQIIKDIKSLILSKEINLVLNLHDGHGFYRKTWENSIFNPTAWGQAFIIDQKDMNKSVKFKELDSIANKVSQNLNNSKLAENHHSFGVKNTETKEKDEQMRLSLTYFAITNSKPAFAIETSKNIPNLTYKVQYQLRAIEEFMKVMGIEFERDFDLNNYNALEKIIYDYKYVTINNNIILPLNDLRDNLFYFPLNSHNKFDFAHPLGTHSVQNDGKVNLHIGNNITTKLEAQNFKLDTSLKSVKMEVDGKAIDAKLPSIVDVKNTFKIVLPDEYRVNIIGFSKQNVQNESNIEINKKDFMNKYSIDNSGKYYRVEIYKNGNFCGMILVKF